MRDMAFVVGFLIACAGALGGCGSQASGSSATGGTGETGGTGGTGGGGAATGGTSTSLGKTCTDNAECGAGELCDWAFCGDGQCGACEGAKMECSVGRKDCNDKDRPVCACDGNVYATECAANAAGQRAMTEQGACTPPAGTFACRAHFCAIDTEACVIEDGLGQFDHCVPLDGSCAPDDCACLQPALANYQGLWQDCGACEVPGAGAVLTCHVLEP